MKNIEIKNIDIFSLQIHISSNNNSKRIYRIQVSRAIFVAESFLIYGLSYYTFTQLIKKILHEYEN